MSYATTRVSTLSPLGRNVCRIAGITLLVVGLTLFILAPITAMRGMESFMGGGSPMEGMMSFVLLGFGGVVLIGVGAFLTRLGFLRLGAEIVATETSGALEHAAGAAGRGWRGSATGGLVKVKCRSCGYLESEDAKFCSRCSKAV